MGHSDHTATHRARPSQQSGPMLLGTHAGLTQESRVVLALTLSNLCAVQGCLAQKKTQSPRPPQEAYLSLSWSFGGGGGSL